MSLGEAIATSRQARGLTQAALAGQLNITQAALSRYEHDLREPTPEILGEIASALGLTADLLLRTDRMKGALAVGAHMRRRATARATAWRRLEAQLSLYRLHTQRLLDEIEFHVELTLPWFDPFEYEPATAARLLRMQWHIPSGPIHNLTGWMEAAGCLIISMDFGTARIDGLSQWGDSHPVIMLNSTAPTDRRRLTLAHELGHLCLHSQDVTDDVEADANAFAAEFLMPAETVRSQLRNLTTGKLHDLKRAWGVSMQALIERAYRLGAIRASERTNLYKTFSRLGWRTHEPVSDELTLEHPQLAGKIGRVMLDGGLSHDEIATIAGFSPDSTNNPFLSHTSHLHLV